MTLAGDIRLGLRSLAKDPGFTAAAVAMLAVGIGINAIGFTVANAVLFKGFPLVKDNDRLMYFSNGGCCISFPDFEDIRARAKSFQGMGIVHGVGRVMADGNAFAENIQVTEVSADTFRVVGQRPIMGRDFVSFDDAPGAPGVVILGYGFWERRYRKDPAVIGRTVRMNGASTTVIGVMPQGFSFPQVADAWVPLVQTARVRNRENTDTWFAFGRLADDVSFQSARAEVEAIIKRLETEYPVTDRRNHLVVQHFDEFFLGSNAAAIYGSLWGAVGFVLLIACANLANLLLARAIRRSREISVRMALGAGRARIVQQLLVESVILSSVGGLLGWWIARWGVRLYAIAMGHKSPWLIVDYTMDRRVLAYLIAISIGTGILFGLAPALHLSKLDVNLGLRDGARGATFGARGKHLSTTLVTGEMALAVALLAGAGVMIRSFLKIHSADMGVDTNNVLVGSIDLPAATYPDPKQRMRFYDRLTADLAAIPGVESAAVGESLPSWGSPRYPYELAGARIQIGNRPKTSAVRVGPAYFRVLRANLLSGREFDDRDTGSSLPVAIVNQLFATEHWPGEDPIGQRLRLFTENTPDAWRTVIGVAANVVQNDMNRQRIDPVVYVPFAQSPGASMWVLLRADIRRVGLGTAFRGAVRSLDPDLPMYGPMELRDRLERFWDTKFYGTLFLISAGVALLLACIGLYSVIAHSVIRRTQEIGIRMAMGATASDILTLVLRQGMTPTAIGLAIGLGGSLALNRLLEAELVRVSPSDPITLTLAASALLFTAVLGCLIPARRAMGVDPIDALRCE